MYVNERDSEASRFFVIRIIVQMTWFRGLFRKLANVTGYIIHIDEINSNGERLVT